MAEVGSAYVSILPSARGFGRALSKEIDGPLGDAGRRGGDTLGRGIESGGKGSFLAAGKGLAGAFAGAFAAVGIGQIVASLSTAVFNFAKDSVTAASDLNESINAVSVAYGDQADAILKIGEAAATGLGLSRNEFNSIAVQFSAFAQQIAGDGGNAVPVIEELTRRGADFASVFNLEVSEALALFQSGLAGETEPLRKFGIDLSAAAVEAWALNNGLIEEGKTLTEQQKVLARYNVLMEQTGKTAGDFANTSDSLANRQRILKAEFENTKAEIGEALLPVVNDMLGVFKDEGVPILRDLANWFTTNKDSIYQFGITAVSMSLMAAEAFLRMTDAGLAWFQMTNTALIGVNRAFLSFVGTMIDGAVRAFGWVPGVGDKLRQAQGDFEVFRSEAERKMRNVEGNTKLLREGVQSAAGAVAGLRGEIEGLRSKTIEVKTIVSTTGDLDRVIRVGQIGMRAHGGPVHAGSPYIVGEREPEMFIPDRPGVILNQSQLRALGVGSGGQVVQNIYPAPGLSEEQIGAAAARRLMLASAR